MIVPIGKACRTAFQINEYYLKHAKTKNLPYPFDWTITPIRALKSVLSERFDINKVLNIETMSVNSAGSMTDLYTNIIHHHDFNSNKINELIRCGHFLSPGLPDIVNSGLLNQAKGRFIHCFKNLIDLKEKNYAGNVGFVRWGWKDAATIRELLRLFLGHDSFSVLFIKTKTVHEKRDIKNPILAYHTCDNVMQIDLLERKGFDGSGDHDYRGDTRCWEIALDLFVKQFGLKLNLDVEKKIKIYQSIVENALDFHEITQLSSANDGIGDTTKDDNPDFYHHLGNLLMKKGDLDGAKEAQEKAISIDHFNPYFHVQLSHIFNKLEDTEQAIVKIRDAIKLKDDNPDFYHYLGSLLMKKGDLNAAKEAQEKAIFSDPSNPKLLSQLNNIFNKLVINAATDIERLTHENKNLRSSNTAYQIDLEKLKAQQLERDNTLELLQKENNTLMTRMNMAQLLLKKYIDTAKTFEHKYAKQSILLDETRNSSAKKSTIFKRLLKKHVTSLKCLVKERRCLLAEIHMFCKLMPVSLAKKTHFNESFYLSVNKDVKEAVEKRMLVSGFIHWVRWGFYEKRAVLFSMAEVKPKDHRDELMKRPNYLPVLNDDND